MMSKTAMKLAKAWFERNTYGDEAVDVYEALCEALAEQPAQQDGPINEGWQITVANGHSGYGLYAHMEDYPEEGAVLVQTIEQPAQQEPVAWRWSESGGVRWFHWTTDWSHYDRAKAMGFPIEYAYTSTPAQQEPVAWMYPDDHERMLTNETFCTVYSVEVGSATRGESTVPLYTSPPPQRKPCQVWDAEGYDALCQELEGWKARAQRKPLTVDQVWQNDQLMSLNAELGCSMDLLVEVVRAIEAAHGIKGDA